MEYRLLGATGLRVSTIAFGAGPVPEVMTSGDMDSQREVVARAIDRGVNWFDTAATYGEGRSESALGSALEDLAVSDSIHVATKVRLRPEQLDNLEVSIRRSVEESLQRLKRSSIRLLQVHNAITANRNDEPTSITPDDVLAIGGVLDVFEKLRDEGLVEHLGITAIGQAPALRHVIQTGRIQAVQIPYSLANPTAGQLVNEFEEANFRNVLEDCRRANVGVLAIRVFAGGALLEQPPSRHTHKTPFFPLDLYDRDSRRAARIRELMQERMSLVEAGLRFVLNHQAVASAIVGFQNPQQVDEAVAAAEKGPLDPELLAALRELAGTPLPSEPSQQ